MNTIYEPQDSGAVAQCRDSFNALYLTDPQFEEFISICTIIKREIHKSGSFIEKLENFAFAVSKSEKYISVNKAETTIRDLFKEMFGVTMNQVREQLAKNFDELTEDQRSLAYEFAKAALTMVEEGDKMPFHRAFAHQASIFANELSITDYAAKKLMSEQFQVQEEREFYEVGKQVEDKFYRPQIEAEKRQRDARRGYTRDPGYTKG